MVTRGICWRWSLLSLIVASCLPLAALADASPLESLELARSAFAEARKLNAEQTAADDFSAAKSWLAQAEKAYADANTYLAMLGTKKMKQEREEEIIYLATMARTKAMTAEARGKLIVASANLGTTQKNLAGSMATIAAIKAQQEKVDQSRGVQAKAEAELKRLEEAQRQVAELEDRKKMELARAQEQEAKRIAERAKEMDEARSEKQKLALMQARLQILEEENSMRVAAGKIPDVGVRSTAEMLVLSIPTASLFIGSGDLDPRGKRILENLGSFLKTFSRNKILIKGYTDNRGKTENNQAVSEKRALRIREYLVLEHGILAGRMTAVGLGSAEPVANNATSAGRALNSRVEVQMIQKE